MIIAKWYKGFQNKPRMDTNGRKYYFHYIFGHEWTQMGVNIIFDRE